MREANKLILASILACIISSMMLYAAYAQDVEQMQVSPQQPQKEMTIKPTPKPTPKGQYIACPVKKVRAEITTPLPEGWWNTPQEGDLVKTGVEDIGGNPTLMCGYQAYHTIIFIMRNFPEGATECKPVEGGFTCQGKTASQILRR